MARDGLLDAVDIVEQADETTDGVWVTTWFADRHDLDVGDPIAFEAGAIADEAWNDLVQGGGENSAFRIVGLYEPLWDSEALDPYWLDVPPELIPQFVTGFNAPNFELVLVDQSTLLASTLTGVLRWRAPAVRLPTTYDEVVELERRYRTLELGLVGTGELGAAMADASTSAGRRPTLTTDYLETSANARRAARRLESPLAAARGVGGIVGLAAAVAVGVFFVERRRSEFRLLASEGEGGVRIAARVAAQLTAPFALGAVIGVIGAVVGPRLYGPADRLVWSELPWPALAVTVLVSLTLAAVTAGVLGVRTLRSPDRVTARAVGWAVSVAVVAVSVAAWVQVGRTVANGETDLDLIVVALPVLVIVVAVGALLIVMDRTLRATGGIVGGPIELFLALRRLARGSGGVRLAAGALGVGIGLIVFAAALTSTLDRTVDVKLATAVGGETAASVVDPLPDDFAPGAPTTMVRYFDTALAPGDVPSRIIAIDPDTYAAAVSWSDQFGLAPEEAIELLSAPFDESIPAIAVGGEPSPPIGAFGITRAFRYRVVERVDAFPLVGDRQTTLLVLAESVDEFALRSAGYTDRADATAAGFAFPVDAFRRLVVSQEAPADLIAALDEAGVRVREVTSQTERRQEPAIVATRAAFGYLGVIGIVALAGALVALALFLSARRRLRALTGVMTRSMGLSPGRAALVSVVELAVVLAVAIGAAFLAVPLVVGRLSDRFDPAPTRPPDVPVAISWPPLIAIAALSAGVVCALVWITERRGGRRPAGEVLRDAA